jgi:hypothetical protein
MIRLESGNTNKREKAQNLQRMAKPPLADDKSWHGWPAAPCRPTPPRAPPSSASLRGVVGVARARRARRARLAGPLEGVIVEQALCGEGFLGGGRWNWSRWGGGRRGRQAGGRRNAGEKVQPLRSRRVAAHATTAARRRLRPRARPARAAAPRPASRALSGERHGATPAPCHPLPLFPRRRAYEVDVGHEHAAAAVARQVEGVERLAARAGGAAERGMVVVGGGWAQVGGAKAAGRARPWAACRAATGRGVRCAVAHASALSLGATGECPSTAAAALQRACVHAERGRGALRGPPPFRVVCLQQVEVGVPLVADHLGARCPGGGGWVRLPWRVAERAARPLRERPPPAAAASSQ